MSGHSKWSTIKRKKGANDAKRGQIFTKMANLITVAARSGGGDPEMNFKLRLAIDRARTENMPSSNIERAIKKGAGELDEGVQLEELTYEAYGPSGAALIIKAITDNKNRTLTDVKTTLKDNSGRLGEMGSVAWMFDSKGVVRVSGKSDEELEMAAIEAGADDILEQEEGLTVMTDAKSLSKVKGAMSNMKREVISADIELTPKDPLKIEDEDVLSSVERLIEVLEDLDDVTGVYSNLAD